MHACNKCTQCLQDKAVREMLAATAITITNDEPTTLTEEEVDKIMEDHACKVGTCRTWLTPFSKQLWLIYTDSTTKHETFIGISYCPKCGFKPEDTLWNKD